jgi:hypothetical protein
MDSGCAPWASRADRTGAQDSPESGIAMKQFSPASRII